MLRVVHNSDIILVEFCASKDGAMDFVPLLDSLCHFRMFSIKFFAYFVKLSKVASPGEDNSLIFHPSELYKVQSRSSSPFKHYYDQISLN